MVTACGLTLDGTGDAATVENFDYAGDGEFSVGFWLKQENCTAQQHAPVYSHSSSTGSGPSIHFYLGTCIDGVQPVRSTIMSNTGQLLMWHHDINLAASWIHLVITMTPSVVKVYVNGVPATLEVDTICALSSANGTGWTIILKTNGDDTFQYDSSYWTNSASTLNDDSDPSQVGNAKYGAYNTEPFNAIKLCVGTLDNSSCTTPHVFDGPIASAASLFDGPYVRDGIVQDEWETVFGVSGHRVCGMQRPGFNTQCAEGNSARWGWCSNVPSQECQLDDADDADGTIGVGIEGQDCCPAGAGWTNSFVSNSASSDNEVPKQAWILIKSQPEPPRDLGAANSPSECVDRVRTVHPSANAATVSAAHSENGTIGCFAHFGMSGTTPAQTVRHCAFKIAAPSADSIRLADLYSGSTMTTDIYVGSDAGGSQRFFAGKIAGLRIVGRSVHAFEALGWHDEHVGTLRLGGTDGCESEGGWTAPSAPVPLSLGKPTASSPKLAATRPVLEEFNPPEMYRSYSSVFADSATGTGHAQSMLDSPQAWSAAIPITGEQWMQIDLGAVLMVGGVVTQGRSDVPDHVTRYRVEVATQSSTDCPQCLPSAA